MFTLVLIVHVIVSLVLIFVVLLQSGKAGDLASAFGGGGSQTAFGTRGAATVLTRATTICAVLFMITSLSLAIMFSSGAGGTVMEGVALPEGAPEESEELSDPVEEPATIPEEPEDPPAESSEANQ